MKKMDSDGDYDNSPKSEGSGKRRSMGGSLEEGVSSRSKIKVEPLRGEDSKSQAPVSTSESIGDGMTIVQ